MRRRRETKSLGFRNRAALSALIRATQSGRFGPLITPQTTELENESGELAAGWRELDDGPEIFERFRGRFSAADLTGRRVLDLGCGYGGRAIYYAETCGAAHVTGLEVDERVVRKCEALATQRDVRNVSFDAGLGEALPYEDRSFDAVVAFDVLEHVTDPERVLRETNRVLVPRGCAWLVFPTYLGARSSHLDYITRMPALHRVFDPVTIVRVVNEFLSASPKRYATPPQPLPTRSCLGRIVLPGLNGLTLADARRFVPACGFEVAHEIVTPIVEPRSRLPLGRGIAAIFDRWSDWIGLPELLIGSIAIVAVRPDR